MGKQRGFSGEANAHPTCAVQALIGIGPLSIVRSSGSVICDNREFEIVWATEEISPLERGMMMLECGWPTRPHRFVAIMLMMERYTVGEVNVIPLYIAIRGDNEASRSSWEADLML